MFTDIIVPLDGSEESARALRPAMALAQALGTIIEVISFHSPHDDGVDLTHVVRQQVIDAGGKRSWIKVEPQTEPIAELIRQRVDAMPGSMVVMSTRGRGRAAALVGSVATDVLTATRQPAVLVGPACKVDDFALGGRLVVAVDDDDATDATLTFVGRLLEHLDTDGVLVNVLDPATLRVLEEARQGPRGSDIPAETAMVSRLAHRLGDTTDQAIDFTVLHDAHAGKAIARYADEIAASLIIMSSHARSGVPRLLLGSVTADALTRATCPVLTIPLAEGQ